MGIRDYELKTVTFGVNSAPFLAIRVLYQLADDEESKYPQASQIIRQFMYVDDVLAGADSKAEAQAAIRELKGALESAGLPLRKWTSNNKAILADIPSDHLLRADFLDIDLDLDLGWDDALPQDLCQRWVDFLKNYSVLDQIPVPRWVAFRPHLKFEHHGFCGASQKAYGAAIYVRVEVGSTVIVNLLTAKTEMAPAVLPKMPGAASALYCWTDSTIVLAWLQKPACQWTTFVANRVTKITQFTDVQK
ncbi:uncharacterized protein [Drosophila bipectinata]|uniref:uncharacterized protein n=1 Tax=Drosophila bipectinata TaxID=42026 RepID=UPI0038B233B7